MKLIERTIDIQTEDGTCDSYVVYPEGQGAWPAVLFLMDGFAVRPYLNEMAKTIAEQGYYVLQPNLFYRNKRAPVLDVQFPIQMDQLDAARTQLRTLISGYAPSLSLKDTESFLSFLGKQKEVLSGKIGITGYCMGGGMAIRAAGSFPKQVAVVTSFHGGNLATDLPASPHTYLKNCEAELYIANADNDSSIPAEQIERLRHELNQSKVRYEMETYSGAIHGFTMKDLPAYNEEALQRHWTKLFEYFNRNLKSDQK